MRRSSLKNVKKTEDDPEAEEEENREVENSGKLLIDATCVPGDIRYPTDLSLLNEGGKSLKKLSIRFMPIAPKARRNRERIGRERERIF
jgi:IS5 family transposase